MSHAAWECERCGNRNPPDVEHCLICNRKPSDYIEPAHDAPDHAQRCRSALCSICPGNALI